ncbi:hypothetical protein [Leptothoe sp. PORK10 BA2]|uniref:hypothetical protein n=1 Tax=Leptothoe sp. PORK10 BA2 TaxID=3110254 RepID=UPI002B1EFA1A|nr:hypothetical protein [Leptothoe sp. PORK10 BA2]MEA5465288.1 hypothetical protein [Leptothoe sp. PORK10 BA2]
MNQATVEVQPNTPSALLNEIPSHSSFLDYGLFAIATFYILRYLFNASAKSSLDSWELLELLVKNLQANNMAILEINQRLAEQLGKRGNDDDT